MPSNTVTVTMSDLVEEVLDKLYRPSERPRQAQLAEAVASNDTAFDLDSVSAGNMAPTDVLEFGRELMLVTAVSGVQVTVSRGYNGTTAAAHDVSTLGTINPTYPRHLVDREIRKCVKNSMQKELPLVVSETLYAGSGSNATDQSMRDIDEDAIDVLDVRYREPLTLRIDKVRGYWDLEDFLPDEAGYTGKQLKVPRGYWDKDLIVTYTCLYSWAGSGESATLTVPLLSSDLPVLYAVAALQTGVEVSRQEFDQIEEWPQQERNARGANVRLLQALWGQYYQQLDAAKGMQNLTPRRPYRRMAHRL